MGRRPLSIDLWLLGVVLVAAVPRVYLGATQFIEYDGYWHVFIASQDNWHQFYKEYQSNFHPPLFYLLLKVAIAFGRSRLVYRAISLITGVAAIPIIARIAERLSFHRYTPIVAAMAYGFALPSIVISCEVRSYMLSIFFVLFSFYYFLDMLEDGAAAKSRVLFAAHAALAGYSHYGAFLYIGASAVTAALFDFTLFRRNLRKRLAYDFATFTSIAAALAYVYLTHGRSHAVIAEHLHGHYFHPGSESLWEFLARNSHQLLNLFTPAPVPGGVMVWLALAVLLLAGGSLIYLIRPLARSENIRASAAVTTSAALFLVIVAGGVFGKYPYGGELRQQFFLFPFAVLCGCVLVDRIAGLLSPRLATAFLFSASIVIIGFWSYAFASFPRNTSELGTAEMKRFRTEFPSPAAVYVDEFNLVNFFIHYHDWRWHFVRSCTAVPAIDIYQVTRGSQSFLLLRDFSRWNLQWQDPALFRDLGNCIREQHLPSLTVFYTQQDPPPDVIQQEPVLGPRILAGATAESLCVAKLQVNGATAYVRLVAGHCETEIPSLENCTKCDDTNWHIAYSGHWVRGEFGPAFHATVTYTDRPGAAARFVFDGTEFRYWYTKAFNRGRAEVVIDGVLKGDVDLYSPNIEWQSSSVFSGLPPGHHTVEIRVTGRHDPAATGAYIDVDALEGR